jgi:alpha-galactosidase
MGWTTYYGLGGAYNERTILSVADALVSTGLARAGYRIVWLDFGWSWGQRNPDGSIWVNPWQWPHGLAWLTAYLHARGLQAGLYTDAGTSGCRGNGLGSLGHYTSDVNQFAAWGFDAVKVDFCGAGEMRLSPRTLYTSFASAMTHNASQRPMLFNVCNLWAPGEIDGSHPDWADSAYASYRWAPGIAQSWRTDTDIGFAHHVRFPDVLRNLDADAKHPETAGPGHWNDPDALAPQIGLSAPQAQAQLSMWAIVAAPLMLGSDPRALTNQSIAMLENPRVLAIDQDALGKQGSVVAQGGQGQVWMRRLSGGARAVALLNRGTRPLLVSARPASLGLSATGRYRIQNVWTGHVQSSASGSLVARLDPASALLYRVTPVSGPARRRLLHSSHGL